MPDRKGKWTRDRVRKHRSCKGFKPSGGTLRQESGFLVLDMHGMVVKGAAKVMNDALREASRCGLALRIIHGHTHGHALRDAVRSWLRKSDEYCSRVRLSENDGETIVERA